MKQTIINYAILPQAFKHTILYMQIYTKFFNMFKGNVSVISSDPTCKDGNARLTTIPLNPLSDLKCGRYCNFSKVFSF